MSERIPRLIEPQKGIRRWGRNVAALAALSATASVPLLSLSPAETECGPHRCEVSLTADGFAEVQPGFMGPARLPLDNEYQLPLAGEVNVPIGAKLRVQEIPSVSSNSGGSTSLFDVNKELSESQIRDLAQLYVGAADDNSEIVDDVTAKLERLALLSAVGLVGLYKVIGTRRRQEIVDTLRQPQSWVGPVVMSLLLSSPLPLQPQVEQRSTWQSTGTLFNGTPLEGLQTKGEIWKYSIYGIKQVIDYQQGIEDYYKFAAKNAVRAIDENEQFKAMKAKYPDAIIVYRTSDEHCNMGMNEVYSQSSEATGATIWLSTGDVGIGHTPLDPICVQQVSKNMTIERIATPGNHDPESLISVFKKSGFIVVDGTVQEVGGLRFLGLPDPNTSPFGRTTPYDPELTRATGKQLLGVACAEEVQPIMIAHSSEMIKATIAAGCATYGNSGHTHKNRIITVPQQDMVNEGFISVLGTSGGAKEGAISLEKLHDPAVVAIDFYTNDEDRATLRGTWLLTVKPDQTATFEALEIPVLGDN